MLKRPFSQTFVGIVIAGVTAGVLVTIISAVILNQASESTQRPIGGKPADEQRAAVEPTPGGPSGSVQSEPLRPPVTTIKFRNLKGFPVGLYRVDRQGNESSEGRIGSEDKTVQTRPGEVWIVRYVLAGDAECYRLTASDESIVFEIRKQPGDFWQINRDRPF